jgi:uncharacterized protein YwgA
MTERFEIVKAILHKFNIELDLLDLDSKIITQKLTFIFQILAKEELYEDFKFYIDGPYSRELVLDYYSDKINMNAADLTQKERDILDKMHSLLNKKVDKERLEIIGSLLFLRLHDNLEWEDAYEILLKLKPRLKPEKVAVCMNDAKRLLITEDEIKSFNDSIKEEIGVWGL